MLRKESGPGPFLMNPTARMFRRSRAGAGTAQSSAAACPISASTIGTPWEEIRTEAAILFFEVQAIGQPLPSRRSSSTSSRPADSDGVAGVLVGVSFRTQTGGERMGPDWPREQDRSTTSSTRASQARSAGSLRPAVGSRGDDRHAPTRRSGNARCRRADADDQRAGLSSDEARDHGAPRA